MCSRRSRDLTGTEAAPCCTPELMKSEKIIQNWLRVKGRKWAETRLYPKNPVISRLFILSKRIFTKMAMMKLKYMGPESNSAAQRDFARLAFAVLQELQSKKTAATRSAVPFCAKRLDANGFADGERTLERPGSMPGRRKRWQLERASQKV